jgi:hypothetical protein
MKTNNKYKVAVANIIALKYENLNEKASTAVRIYYVNTATA